MVQLQNKLMLYCWCWCYVLVVFLYGFSFGLIEKEDVERGYIVETDWPMMSEEMIRLNPNKDGIVYASPAYDPTRSSSSSDEWLLTTKEDLLYNFPLNVPRVAYCMTGYGTMNLERWETHYDSITKQIFYYSPAKNASTFEIPCVAFMAPEPTQEEVEDQWIAKEPEVHIEQLDYWGIFRTVSQSSEVHWLLRSNGRHELYEQTLQQQEQQQSEEQDINLEIEIELVLEDFWFHFENGPLDHLKVLDFFLNNTFTHQEVIEKKSVLSSSVQVYEEQISLVKDLEMTMAQDFFLAHEPNENSTLEWQYLRQVTPFDRRQEIAKAWYEMGQFAMDQKKLNQSIQCFRRAINWLPSYLDVYLEIVSLINQMAIGKFQSETCQIMEKMLQNVNSTINNPFEMRSILMQHFSHCSLIIRIVTLWETSTLFRYVLMISIALSFLHGLFVTGCFLYEKMYHYTSVKEMNTKHLVEEETSTGGSIKKKHKKH